MEGEMKERRKIQFSVPSAVPTQLDPKQVEMIRRRRPTPATLFRMTDHPSPEEENPSHQLAVCENGVLKSKRVNTAVYQPPSIKAVQKMVEAHMQSSETGHGSRSSESSDNEEAFPDSDRDPPDDSQSDHHSASEVTKEDTGSTKQQNIQVEDIKGMAESQEVGKSTENTDNGKNPPAVTRSDQSDHHVTDDDTDSTQLHDVSGEDDEGANQSKKGVDKCAGNTDNGKIKQKGED